MKQFSSSLIYGSANHFNIVHLINDNLQIWNNTLQQYAENHVKQFNPNVTLTRQHYNNSLGVNIGDNGDVKSAIRNNQQYQLQKNKLRRFYNYEMTTTEVPPETTSYLLEPGRCECIC
ncbi:hypothetical protein KSF78_0009733 [Schistosoma japonicum]|nr:hypothetical protein KSF78_0009733 [Schistosoma japonicum]